MSESDGIQVKFSADIQSLLSGMKDGQEAVKTATEGMKGDLGSMIESFEKFGMAAVAIGGVGLAFEGLKEGISFMQEATEKTNSLAKAFEGLQTITGASLKELGEYDVTAQMVGGSVEDLNGWIMSGTRAMKANEEVFIANGIAADHASLMQLSFGERLAKSVKVIEETTDSGTKLILMQELLGRSGVAAYPQIKRFVETLGEGKETFKQVGAAIDEEVIARMVKMEKEAGKLSATWQKTMADMDTGTHYWANGLSWALGIWNQFLEGGARNTDPTMLGDGSHNDAPAAAPKTGKNGKTAEDIAEEKAAAAERVALAKATAEEVAKAAMDGIQEQLKSEKSLADQGEMSFEEQIGLERQHATEALQIELDKDNKLLALEKGKPLEIQKTNNDIEAAQRAFNAKMSDLDNQQAQMRVNVERETDLQMKKLAEEAAKESAEVAKIAARESLAAAKDAINEKKKDLDLEVAMGQITGKQEVAQRIAFIQQEEAAEKQQLQQELTNQSLSVARRADINAQIVDLERRTQSQIDDIKRKAAEEQFNSDMAKMQGMEANWNQGIQKMLAGQESLSKGLKSAMMGIGEYWEKTLIDMGLKELNENAISLARYGVLASTKKEQDAATAATKTATTATSNSITDNAAALSAMVQIADWAAVAEAAAFAAYAGIPVVGPALGLAAAAEAGATTMSFMSGLALSSAAGGWDQVPSDQLAMIHKNEMILPAPLAQSVRDMSEAGGGGATHVHLHGVTDASWWAHNQAHIVGQVREAMRNNRMGAR